MNEINLGEKNEKSVEQIAYENFESWNDTLQTKDAKLVAKKYLETGELFGTVSTKIRQGREEIAKYFEHFLQINPSGKVVERKVVKASDNTYIDSGLYNFTVERNGKKEVVEAMFTYVWGKTKNNDWKILHHHSAVKNEMNQKMTAQSNINYEKNNWTNEQIIGQDAVLKTGFVTHNKKTVRITLIMGVDGDIIIQQVSEIPEESGV
jgi:uncharacterized protein (TIGR02246 family)